MRGARSVIWARMIAIAALALEACTPAGGAHDTAAKSTPAAAPVAAPKAAFTTDSATPDLAGLLNAPDRPVEDIADDSNRKPAEVLAFSHVRPGQTVLELEAGGGYYTELLSRLVGPKGRVMMQNPIEFESFNGEAIAKRLAGGRLPNVTQSRTHFDALEAKDGSIDVATWFLGPHELYFHPQSAPKGFGDPNKTWADIARVLKPGGLLVVMDHAAKAGAPTSSGNDLHRIDPALIRASAKAAGFIVEEESALLANPQDDHAKVVFDPSIRRRTDQVLIRFRKAT